MNGEEQTGRGNGHELYYLEYETSDDQRVFMKFQNENDRDGCHISLDMYKVQLGPVTMAALCGVLRKFRGELVCPPANETL